MRPYSGSDPGPLWTNRCGQVTRVRYLVASSRMWVGLGCRRRRCGRGFHASSLQPELSEPEDSSESSELLRARRRGIGATRSGGNVRMAFTPFRPPTTSISTTSDVPSLATSLVTVARNDVPTRGVHLTWSPTLTVVRGPTCHRSTNARLSTVAILVAIPPSAKPDDDPVCPSGSPTSPTEQSGSNRPPNPVDSGHVGLMRLGV